MNYKWVIVSILLVIPAILPFFRSGFFPTHDSVHVPRIYQMDKGIRDGQFPVRWTPDVRYGEATFNFYAPLPYYIGSLFSHMGLSYINATKAVLILGFILSSLGVFLLVREMFDKWAGIVAAAFYTYAPYHSVDIYVRGALPESVALGFLPFIFLGIYRLFKKQDLVNFVLLSLSIGGLLLTHNVMSLMFAPFAALWVVFLFFQKRNYSYVKFILLATAIGLGVSSFFWLPAFVEKDLVQNKYLTSGYFDFRGHFVGVDQFFRQNWGYESSVFGTEDNISFQLGMVHWIGIFLAIIFLLWNILKNKRAIRNFGNICVAFVLFLLMFSLFIQHNQSAFAWEAVSIMEFIQFPWRFLGISIFLASIIVGYVIFNIEKYKKYAVYLAVISVIVVNFSYFQPRIYEDLQDKDYIADEVLANKDRTPKDYLPNAVRVVKDRTVSQPQVLPENMRISDFEKRTSSASFNAEVFKTSHISVPIYYFPNWEVYIDGRKVVQTDPNDEGWIGFNVPEGKHYIELRFENTQVRTIGNIISSISILILLFLIIKKWRNI